MTVSNLDFERPDALQATRPAEMRGLSRDGVRLLVSGGSEHLHARFTDLPELLHAGDLLVVNDSATLPASLPAEGPQGPFVVNLSTRYADDLWLVEPRWSQAEPGPIGVAAGWRAHIAGLHATFIAPYPGLPRLWFTRFSGDVHAAMRRQGEPIRYRYVTESYPLSAYQTLFARRPGSAEMPSAARPFTRTVVDRLTDRGVGIAGITLHTGVSSLEVDGPEAVSQPFYPEPFEVTARAAALVNATRRGGRRVIAIGTTVVRALESAWNGERVASARGFTRHVVGPERRVKAVDGLLTGFHDPQASHLAMLLAIAGPGLMRDAYGRAVQGGYLWHEFGDSHLILA